MVTEAVTVAIVAATVVPEEGTETIAEEETEKIAEEEMTDVEMMMTGPGEEAAAVAVSAVAEATNVVVTVAANVVAIEAKKDPHLPRNECSSTTFLERNFTSIYY